MTSERHLWNMVFSDRTKYPTQLPYIIAGIRINISKE